MFKYSCMWPHILKYNTRIYMYMYMWYTPTIPIRVFGSICSAHFQYMYTNKETQ